MCLYAELFLDPFDGTYRCGLEGLVCNEPENVAAEGCCIAEESLAEEEGDE